jgi:Flp pilus assembly pilin Flp
MKTPFRPRNDDGQDMVEYALLASFISIVATAARSARWSTRFT